MLLIPSANFFEVVDVIFLAEQFSISLFYGAVAAIILVDFVAHEEVQWIAMFISSALDLVHLCESALTVNRIDKDAGVSVSIIQVPHT